MENVSQNMQNPNLFSWDKEAMGEITLVEYIWIDGSGKSMRSKTKTVYGPVNSVEDLDWWTFDGSSCMQATTTQSEIYLKPVFLCRDPMRKGFGKLCLCETYLPDKKTPARFNFRHWAEKIMDEAAHEKPWFGMEQEFFLKVRNGTTDAWPLGWPKGGYPHPQGQYYCSVGDQNAFGRAVIEAAYRAFLYAGLAISGINAEVAPGQWEYQVGIAKGIEGGDHMWMARYILGRLGEEFGVVVDFEPKPVLGDWNGSGCHCNFSLESTRNDGGLQFVLEECMKRLAAKHKEHILLYGEGNHLRLTGAHETSSIDKFDYGEGNRGASIRIPILTLEKKKGYFEDRRPASNIDPYLVTGALVDTCVLNSKYIESLVQAYQNSTENNF